MKITMYLFGIFHKYNSRTTYCSDGIKSRLAKHRKFLQKDTMLIVGDIVKVELPLPKGEGKKNGLQRKVSRL